eukprot:1158764-Pelagomonas_calceolata.AAC.7
MALSFWHTRKPVGPGILLSSSSRSGSTCEKDEEHGEVGLHTQKDEEHGKIGQAAAGQAAPVRRTRN